MKQWKLSEQNFENFNVGGLFFKKCKNCSKNFKGLVTSGRHNSAVITKAENVRLNGSPSFQFYRWNQFKVFPLGSTLRTGSTPTKRFRDFDYILMISIAQQYWVTWHYISSNIVSKTAYLRSHSTMHALRYQFRAGQRFCFKIIIYHKVGHNSISHY